MPPTDRKGTLFGGDAVHVALILQTRATARRAIRVHCVQRRRQRRAAGGFAAVRPASADIMLPSPQVLGIAVP
jgi:hypothetical protein